MLSDDLVHSAHPKQWQAGINLGEYPADFWSDVEVGRGTMRHDHQPGLAVENIVGFRNRGVRHVLLHVAYYCDHLPPWPVLFAEREHLADRILFRPEVLGHR